MKAETELRKPMFWAMHFYNIVGTEDRGSGEFVEAVFGVPDVDEYYLTLLRPEKEAYLLALPMAGGYDAGVEYVDCGENGTEVRYSLGCDGWNDREPLGYESPHFALPAFRWDEVELIARAVQRSSAERAAMAMLLLFPAVYLTRTDQPDIVEQALLRAWTELRLPSSAAGEGLIRSAVDNQRDDSVTWINHRELGWINDGRYSFRNPKTSMTPFEPRRFARVNGFLRAIESAASA